MFVIPYETPLEGITVFVIPLLEGDQCRAVEVDRRQSAHGYLLLCAEGVAIFTTPMPPVGRSSVAREFLHSTGRLKGVSFADPLATPIEPVERCPASPVGYAQLWRAHSLRPWQGSQLLASTCIDAI